MTKPKNKERTNSVTPTRKENWSLENQLKFLKRYLDANDFGGLAEAFQEVQIKWHVKEWKEFIRLATNKEVKEALGRVEERFLGKLPMILPKTEQAKGFKLCLKMLAETINEIEKELERK